VGFADASSLQLSGPGKGHMRQSTGVAQFSKGNWEEKSAAHVFLTVYTILPSPVVLPAPAAIEGFFILSDVFLLASHHMTPSQPCYVHHHSSLVALPSHPRRHNTRKRHEDLLAQHTTGRGRKISEDRIVSEPYVSCFNSLDTFSHL